MSTFTCVSLQQEVVLVFCLPHHFLVGDAKIVENNLLRFSVEMVSRQSTQFRFKSLESSTGLFIHSRALYLRSRGSLILFQAPMRLVLSVVK